MQDLTRAQNVGASINEIISAPASTRVRVPEIEGDSTEDAIRKLQVQIFVLSDCISDLTTALGEARKALSVKANKGSRVYP